MSFLLALDWRQDAVSGVEADLSGGKVRVRRTLEFARPEVTGERPDPAALGDWLRSQLSAAGVEAREVLLVLPRDEFVTRRLELPNAPESELPDLVRFQAASKSTTPLDQLALDFVPLPVTDPSAGRPAMMATIDRQELQDLQAICTAAHLELKSIEGSPFAISEVAARAERQRGEDPSLATLVVFQDEHRVELSILQGLGLVFSHQTRLRVHDERAIRATMAEINRSIVVLGQAAHGAVELARVCLIHDGEVDPALEQALEERFAGRLHIVDPADDEAVAAGGEGARLAALAPAVGALLGRIQRTVPSIDFLNPRRPPPKRDERKRRMVLGGVAAAVALALAGTGLWAYGRRLDGQIAALRSRDADLTRGLEQYKPAMEDHQRVQEWVDSAVDPLTEVNRLNRLMPGTDRLLLQNINVLPGSRGAVAKLVGNGIARSERTVQDFLQTLSESGYAVRPQVTETYRLDPDYPYRFLLDMERLPDRPSDAAAAGPAP